MKKFTVQFFIKSDKSKDGVCPIFIRIKLGGKPASISTGRHCDFNRWKKTKQLRFVRSNTPEASLQSYIYELKRDLELLHLQLYKELGDKLTTQDIKRRFLFGEVIENEEISFQELCQKHLQYFDKKIRKDEGTEATKEKYKRAERFFLEFLDFQYGLKDIKVSSITSDMIFTYDHYLRYEHLGNGKKGLGNNTAVKYIRNLNTITRYGFRLGLIKDNPFKVYDGKLVETDTMILLPEELEKIENVHLSSLRLQSVRDLFVFSCYTSLAPVDIMRLSSEHIIARSDGDKWFSIKRQKSKVESKMLLLPKALEILDRYKGDPRCDEAKLLPRYSNQKMNDYLKEIAKAAGINKELHYYCARHTFATTVCLYNDVNIKYISTAMGHRKLSQTEHYAKVLDGAMERGMKNLREKISKKS